MLQNPFIIAGKIPEDYFCDRREETDKLCSHIINQRNVVLMSPRRMGKSGLIHHCFERNQIKESYKTLYIDILQSSSLQEFVFLFGKAVFENLVSKTQLLINNFFKIIKSLNGKFSVDPFTGLPLFNIMLGDITHPDITLKEIFTFIESFEGRCVIAFDEFQQIAKYPEKNVEAILRSYISQTSNANFIFAGSERHLLGEMFESYNRPFYHSAMLMWLDPIPEKEYQEFALKMFRTFKKKLNPQGFQEIYHLFGGVTFYIQKTLNVAFSKTSKDQECGKEILRDTILEILEDNSAYYREVLSNMPIRQKELLYAIAIDENVERITGAEFIRKHNLLSASSVQAAMKQMLERDYITCTEKRYRVTDKFLSLWIKQMYGPNHLPESSSYINLSGD